MNEGQRPDTGSPTASRWFALRHWYRRSPLHGVAIALVLVAMANVVLHLIGARIPAPFLPFYPAIIFGVLLGGRPTGYGTLVASQLSAAYFLFGPYAEAQNASVLWITLGLSFFVGTLVVEILAQLSNLAEALHRRETVLAANTEALLRQEARLIDQLSELEALYDEAPIGLGFLDRDLRFVRINAALADMNGFTVAEHLGKSVWDLLPDLRASAEPVLHQVLDSNEVVRNVELSGETPAQPGVARDWLEMFYPVHDRQGVVQGVGIFCEEVTEAKRAREREVLLTREVDHRAKNLLTVIQSVLKLTRSTGSVDEFKAAVIGRIQSLGRVHTLLAQSRWEAILLDELVRRELEPFGAAVRIGTISPALRIQPAVAQAISMILHELATNSVKHGALSGQGYVAFGCVLRAEGPAASAGELGREGGETPAGIEGGTDEPSWGEAGATPHGETAGETGWVTLTWSEHDGPEFAPPARSGFGTSLIRTAVKGMLAGELDYQLHPTGLHCQIRFPLHRASKPPVGS